MPGLQRALNSSCVTVASRVSIPAFVGSLYSVDQACPTFCTVRSDFAKFGLHASNTNFNTKNEDCIIICTIIIFLLYFSIRNVQ